MSMAKKAEAESTARTSCFDMREEEVVEEEVPAESADTEERQSFVVVVGLLCMALAESGVSGRHLAPCRFDVMPRTPPCCVVPPVKNPADGRGAVASSSSSAESTKRAIRILLFTLLGVTIPDDDDDDRIFSILQRADYVMARGDVDEILDFPFFKNDDG
jgi:hypothetical protein